MKQQGVSPKKRISVGLFSKEKGDYLTIREFKKAKYQFKAGKVLDKDGEVVKDVKLTPFK